jgi:hypothetical protein
VDRLAAVLRGHPRRPVDADEVTLLLESTGFTDRTAVHGYRQPGVFALAARVLRRLGPVRVPPPALRWQGVGRLGVARGLAAVALLVAGARWGVLTVLPALVAVPPGELLAAWCGGQGRLAAARYDDPRAVVRHRAAVARRALLTLVPPLLVAAGLLAAAGHLPGRAVLLRAAVAVLLAGWYPLLLLLATARRPVAGLAALLAVAGPWPLAGGYLGALVVAAAGLSTGPYEPPASLPRVLSHAVPRPRRLAKPPRPAARPAGRRA